MLQDCGERGKEATDAMLAYLKGEPYRWPRPSAGECIGLIACTLFTAFMGFLMLVPLYRFFRG